MLSWTDFDELVQRLKDLNQPESMLILSELIKIMDQKHILNLSLNDMNSHDWMILYKAVIEVEAGQ